MTFPALYETVRWVNKANYVSYFPCPPRWLHLLCDVFPKADIPSLVNGNSLSFIDAKCSLSLSAIFAEPLALLFLEDNLAFASCHLVKAAAVALATRWANIGDIGQFVLLTTIADPCLAVFSGLPNDILALSKTPVGLAHWWVWLGRVTRGAGLA